jgi:hypothetical protein
VNFASTCIYTLYLINSCGTTGKLSKLLTTNRGYPKLIFFAGCAKTPTTKLPDGNAGYVVQLNTESAFLLPAEFFKITENDGYWSIWNKELHSSIKLCKNKSAVSRAYSSYTGGRDYDVVSSHTKITPLGKHLAEGEIVTEMLSINGHSRMMVKGIGPGFVALQDSGKSNKTDGKSVTAIFPYWTPGGKAVVE